MRRIRKWPKQALLASFSVLATLAFMEVVVRGGARLLEVDVQSMKPKSFSTTMTYVAFG